MTTLTSFVAPDDGDDGFERIDRYQTLEPGTYWRSRLETRNAALKQRGYLYPDTAIRHGVVLLLVNVRMFDGAPHTVDLLQHPEDGDAIYQMLVNDFLEAFEPAPDGEAVREQEMADIHRRVSAIQQELIEAQTNPSIIEAHVSQEMKLLAQQDPTLADSSRTDLTVARGAVTPSTFIAARAGTEVAVSIQSIARRQHAIADIKTRWLQERTEAISSTLQKLAPFYAEKAQVALARTRSVRDYADELMKSLRSLDLYIGTGVEVNQIADGEPAASESEPLSLLQRKLFMDEELAAWADIDESFDFTQVDEFDRAIAGNASLRDQIFPYPRAVVSMAVRRHDRHYENPYEHERKNEINRRVFLLVRNGERIYRVHSAQPSHERAERLFPTKNEMDELFQGYDGERISFQDLQFTRQADAAENLSLSYKRMLILLCGLDHRLGLFGQFYPQQEALSFVSLGFQERYMRFVADDDEGLLLSGPKRVQPVEEWLVRANSHLRSGSRVFCLWNAVLTPDTAPGMLVRERDYVDERASPVPHELPAALKIAYRDGRDICVDVRAYRKSDQDSEFNARVNLTRTGADGQYSATKVAQMRGLSSGFLCLDAVSADEVDHYVFSRADRVRHTGYIRLFKRASAQLRIDEAAQADARAWLVNEVLNSEMFAAQEPGFAGRAVDAAIMTWRASSRGAALPTLDQKARLKPVLDLVYRDAHSANLESRVQAFAAERNLTVLRIALSGRNKVLLYCPPTEAERAPYTASFRWVRRYTLEVLKTRLSVASEKWIWLQHAASDAGEQILLDTPELDAWINDKVEPCPVRAMDDARTRIEASLAAFAQMFGNAPADGLVDESFNALFSDVYHFAFGQKYIRDTDWHIPVGYIWNDRGLSYVCAELNSVPWLYRFADARQRRHIEDRYIRMHADKDTGRKKVLTMPYVRMGRVQSTSLDSTGPLPRSPRDMESAQRAFSTLFPRKTDKHAFWVEYEDMSNDAFLTALSQSEHGARLWLSPALFVDGIPRVSHLFEKVLAARLEGNQQAAMSDND